MNREGFTLLEVLAVVVVLALLAGAVAWSLAADAHRASSREVVARLRHADQMARLASRRFGRACELRIDLDRQTLRQTELSGRSVRQTAQTVTLPDGHRIEAVVLAPADGAAAARTIRSGVVTLGYSRGGRSVSYALRVVSPEDRRWLVFAGLTGQMTCTHDADDIHNLLRTSARPDAR